MILQALTRYYQRLVTSGVDDIAPYGYSPEKISYEILLAPDGAVVQVNDIRDTSGKKPQPRVLQVPQVGKRTSGIKSSFLWDKTSYALGVSATSKRADKEHEAFKALHLNALSGIHDPGVKALLAFLHQWSPDQFQAPKFPSDMLDSNIVFRLDGEQTFLHQREAAQSARARLLEEEDQAGKKTTGMCLVTGESHPIEQVHPAIKGVKDAQTSGASIVSFNLDAFKSYGKDQGANAPVSVQAAFAYTTALNYLLRHSEHNRQRLQIGDATVVFWAEAENPQHAVSAEFTLANLLSPPPDDSAEAEKIRRILDGIARGHPLPDIEPGLLPNTKMYVLGLAPNASRLSVRFWQVGTLDAFTRRIVEHERDMHIEPVPWKTTPSAYRLVLATVPYREGTKPKSEDAPRNLIGETMRAILSGGLYPRSLLANTIMRIRADGNLSGPRAALCKGVLTRERRKGIRTSKEEIPVSLDKQSTQRGYLLGRLFAILDRIQYGALGGRVNATIRDRYYGAASATPASIFPVLVRNTQNHLGKLRKEKPGLAINLEKDIREVINSLGNFPRSLSIEDQGRFAIGYYHQSQAYFTKHDENTSTEANIDTDSEGDIK